MERARLRWGVAIIAAVIVAEVAVVLLRPRNGVIEPARVSTESYFSVSDIERARDYRRPQLAIYGGVLAIEFGVLALLVARPPRRLQGPFKRTLLAGAAAGAALSVVVTVAILPLQVVSRERAKDVGLVTQSWSGYARDKAIAGTIGAILAGLGAATALGLMRRMPRNWWAPGTVIVVAFGVGSIYAGPVVLDPLFNTFQPLPAGQAREDVFELAERAGVDVGEVYSVDASRRTTAANAYVAGLGKTKRVVLYDTLLENFKRDEVRLVVAHELAHVHHRDVPNGLLYLAIVTPFGLFAVAQLTRRFAPDGKPGPAVLPALALGLFVMTTTITTISNQLSRHVEARADSYALTLTDEAKPFISFEKRIALRNLSDPDPPDWQTFFLATHPPTIERIGIGVAYERGER
ncbi:MAG TPA: M48 family metallopeptidase [Solirubrobacteraceae bacterium]|nr:M48 family metallopeptidase [Solirubrobacteraceae bacterium]